MFINITFYFILFIFFFSVSLHAFVKKLRKTFFFTLNSSVAADIVAVSMQRYVGNDYVYFNSIASFRLRYYYSRCTSNFTWL